MLFAHELYGDKWDHHTTTLLISVVVRLNMGVIQHVKIRKVDNGRGCAVLTNNSSFIKMAWEYAKFLPLDSNSFSFLTISIR